ncbi:MAG TPA: hypothetical protein VMR34_05295 [Candidatus Saccharimonadales bacterium]|nr:hypothetical protein [Candidatus Saccharimonadales bacterium]
MSETRGTTNKTKQPPEVALSEAERIELIANLIIDIISEEQEKQIPGDELCKVS